MIDKHLLIWFGKYHKHILSHYLASVSRITKRQRKNNGELDGRQKPAKVLLELFEIYPGLNRDLLDDEREQE